MLPTGSMLQGSEVILKIDSTVRQQTEAFNDDI